MGKASKGIEAVAGALALLLGAGCGAGANEGLPGEEVGALEGPLASTDCPRAPEGSHPEAVKALDLLNKRRAVAGLGCVNFSAEIAEAARLHCAYYTANKGACVTNPHKEVAGCQGFVAESFGDRIKAASYKGRAAYEVMAYFAKGERAVDAWIDSVWHRIPMMSPRVRDVGYGTSGICDTMDFGYGDAAGPQKTVFYPAADQTGVPTHFYGNERPEPPKPPKGWPSGYPVTLYAAGVTITSHQIVEDEKGKALEHTFLAPGDPRAYGLLYDEFFLYTHDPLKKKTRYRVILAGTKAGEEVRYEWTFTTR
jgi:uncharacterized protein YkwD